MKNYTESMRRDLPCVWSEFGTDAEVFAKGRLLAVALLCAALASCSAENTEPDFGAALPAEPTVAEDSIGAALKILSDTQAVQSPQIGNPSTDQVPTTQRPVTQEPTTQEPATQEPATQEPATQEPATQEPATQEPATQEPATQEPATQEPATQEPATQEPATQEPATQEPATQEPTTQEPTTQEPATQEPPLTDAGGCNNCSNKQLTLEWSAASDTDIGYFIYYGTNPDSVESLATSIMLDNPAQTQEMFSIELAAGTDLGLEAGSPICFSVSALNSFGESDKSSTVCQSL